MGDPELKTSSLRADKFLMELQLQRAQCPPRLTSARDRRPGCLCVCMHLRVSVCVCV